jgi:hypothetical protein
MGTLLLGALASPARAAGPPARDPVEAIVPTLRAKCVDFPWHGVLIKQKTTGVIDGQLVLDGFVDNAKQRDLVLAEANKVLARSPGVRVSLTSAEPVVVKKLRVVPLRSAYLKKYFQADFARADRGKKVDEVRDVLRETRLDTVYYNPALDDQLTFVGVCTVFIRGLNQENARATIVKGIQAVLRAPELAEVQAVSPRVPNAEQVKLVGLGWDERPTTLLQKMMYDEPRLDGALFRQSWYDANGTLHLELLVRAKGDVELVRPMVKELAGKYLAFRPEHSKKASVSLEVSEWAPRMALEVIQARLSTSPVAKDSKEPPVLRRTRLDRWRLIYPTDGRKGVLEVVCKGVCLDNIRGEMKAGEVRRFLRAEFINAWPALAGPAFLSVDVEGITPQRYPRFDVQGKVADNPRLDGVGVDEFPYFAADGKLALRGVWPQRTGVRDGKFEKELKEVVLAELKRLAAPLVLKGLECDLSELRTDEILQDLREWSADTLEEAYAERLYFDRVGRMTLKGFVAHVADRKKVYDKFLELLRNHPQTRGEGKKEPPKVQVPLLTPPFVKGRSGTSRPVVVRAMAFGEEKDGAGGPGFDFEVRPGLTDLLRRRVQVPAERSADPPVPRKWDGILIRRGFFNPEGKYGVEGLLGSEAQRDGLDKLLSELSTQVPWKRILLPKKWEIKKRMRVIPLEPMLQRMRLVMPAYPMFDGLVLDSAAHDVKGKLVLRIAVVGAGPSPRALPLMTKMLQEHDPWRLRVEGGARWLLLDRQPADETHAYNLLLKAIGTLRLGMLQPGASRSTGVCGLAAICPDKPAEGKAEAKKELTQEERVALALQMLNVSLLHNPRDAAAWYLRALCHLLRRETVEAERDMRRLVRLEDPDFFPDASSRRAERLRLLEPLQGAVRRQAEELKKKVELDVLAGRPAIRLAP